MKRIGYMLAMMGMAAYGMNGLFSSDQPLRILHPYGTYVHQLKTEAAPETSRVTLHSQASYNDSDKKIARKGVLVRYPGAQATVVICHGFMCDKFDVGFVRQLFPTGKFNFLSFDFRAHGEESKNQCCTFGKDEALDVIAAAEYVKNHPELKKLPLFVYGFSMGAVASIEAQAQRPDLFKALILDCPFDSSENVVKKAISDVKISLFGRKFDMPGKQTLQRYVFHPYVQEFVKFVLKSVGHMDSKNIPTYIYRFSPAESVRKIAAPCMFIHCKEDQRVPVDAVHSLFKGARGPKRLWVTNGRRHYDSIFYNPEKYSKKITSFFNDVLSGAFEKKSNEDVLEDSDEEQVVPRVGV